MRLTSVVFLALASSAFASPAAPRWNEPRVKHSWNEIPGGWTRRGIAPPDHKLVMRIGLKQARLAELIDTLHAVSDPLSPRYGQHLSKDEADALAAPSDETSAAVNTWLLSHGVEQRDVERTVAGSWLKLSVPVEKAEQMLNTRYEIFGHAASGDNVVRTMSYSLPTELHEHIDVVTPTTYFGTLRAMRATSHISNDVPEDESAIFGDKLLATGPNKLATVPASCSSKITPDCLRTLYNTAAYVPLMSSSNTLGIAGYLDEFANDADLQTFFKSFRTDAVGATMTHVQLNSGKNDQSDPGSEANLDIQYTMGIAYPTKHIYYSTGGSPPFNPDSATTTNSNEPYLDWLNYVLGQSSIPQTFSTSYGDDEQTVPQDYATSVCNLFATLGARGASILFSSGDDGVGRGTCRTNDGKNTVKFQPAFPASCPYVTTVGGTNKIPEVGISFSGGGYSNYFTQPSWQSTAVKAYQTAFGTTYASSYNATGRAYPDISAQSNSFQIVLGGRTRSIGGTSASAPTVAAIVALLNDYRLSLGKSPLGFLNPVLYGAAASAAALNDITSGSNPGCSTNGFSARAGWDPVTGLGTPDFTKLQAVVKNL